MDTLLMCLLATVLQAAPPEKQRNLTPEEQKEVDRLRSPLDRLFSSGQFEEAVQVARDSAAYRAERQGANHWQVIDARLQAERWQRWASVPRKERPEALRALTLDGEAAALQQRVRYREAETKRREALEIYRKLLGEQHSLTATSYNELGSCLNAQGKHAEALPFYRKALDIRLKQEGDQHPDTGTNCNNLALCLNSQGKHAEALPLFQKAQDIHRKTLGEQHPLTATSCNNVGLCLNDLGRHADALALFQQALDIRRKVLGELHPNTATSCTNVAYCLRSQGKPSEALPLFQKALDICRKVLGEQHPQTALSYGHIANCLSGQGKYGEAVALQRKALDICRKALGEQHPQTANHCTNLGLCLTELGQHAEALPLLQEALATRLKVLGERHPDTATSRNSVAHCLEAQGKSAEALPFYREALDSYQKSLGEQHPDTASGYHNLAFGLLKQGQEAEALALFQKTLEIKRKVLGEQHYGTARTCNMVAFCLYRQGKYAEAVQHWETALLGLDTGRLQTSASGFERSHFRAGNLSPRAALAVTLVQMGQPMRAWEQFESNLARGLLDDLLPSAETSADAEKQARVQGLGRVLLPLLSREQLALAERDRRDLLVKQRDELLAELARSAARRSLERVLPLPRIQKQIPTDAALVFWLQELGQHFGGVLRHEGPPVWVRLSGSGKDDAWTRDDDSLPRRTLLALADPSSEGKTRQELVQQLHRQRIAPLEPHLKLVKRLLVVPAGMMAAVPVEALTQSYTISYVPSASVFARRMETHRALEPASLLVLADPVFTRSTPVPPPAPPQGLLIKAVLPGSLAASSGLRPGDVLIEYGETKLTRPDDLKPATGSDPVPLKLWRDGRTLSGRIPAGKLGVVLDERSLDRALADWRREQSEALSRSRGLQDWPPLPGTRLEARMLAALMPAATSLLGSDASEQRLEELAASGKLKGFRLLHFATHGEANQVQPGDTALILSQDRLPSPDEDARLVLAGQKPPRGLLTVGKVLERWELDADLVVLSACQTGLGKTAGGEGMLGFTQALMQKGARSVVLSRWKVDDAATALLMARFYENLLGRRAGDVSPLRKALPRAEALMEAKTWLRLLSRDAAANRLAALVDGVPRGERGSIQAALPARKPDDPKGEDRPFAHPYYWAAFVVIGDPH